jgi:hypothetical protein
LPSPSCENKEKIFPKLFFLKKYFPILFYKNSFGNIFFLIYFFTAEVSHFFGTKNSKKYFCAKTILENIFLRKKNVFEFFVPKK